MLVSQCICRTGREPLEFQNLGRNQAVVPSLPYFMVTNFSVDILVSWLLSSVCRVYFFGMFSSKNWSSGVALPSYNSHTTFGERDCPVTALHNELRQEIILLPADSKYLEYGSYRPLSILFPHWSAWQFQEVQNILALQNVETPLKGGLNTPLPEADFRGILPTPQIQATPNTVLNAVAATPSSAFGGGKFTCFLIADGF